MSKFMRISNPKNATSEIEFNFKNTRLLFQKHIYTPWYMVSFQFNSRIKNFYYESVDRLQPTYYGPELYRFRLTIGNFRVHLQGQKRKQGLLGTTK